jgi:6-phosphogluconolactonase (cycloisomerase 2 family)
MKILSINKQNISLKQMISISCFSLGLGFLQPADAIVYTSSNEAASNRVLAFDINLATGNLIELDSFPTGGTGTGAPLGNQSAITTDASDRWMFVTNAGDGSVTSFRLQKEGLQFVNKIDSRGHSPISVTVFGTLVYVLNEGSGLRSDPPRLRYDNISGFRFNNVGELEFIRGSVRIIDRTQLTSPAQVGFNKSGTVLLITEKATNTLTTYVMRRNGRPERNPLKRPSAIPTPFGFEFGDRDYVFITEANGGGQGVTASYRIDRATGEVSPLVDVIEQGDATCWTVLNSDQTIGYSVNTGSDSVSLYNINFDGTIAPFTVDRTPGEVFTGAAPRDAVITQNNQSLVTLNNGDGEIRAFGVRRTGSISRRNTMPVPTSVTGLVAR